MIQLTGDDIATHWDLIKYAACQVNPLQAEKNIELFCRNLLKNLMCNAFQCWITLSDDKKIINLTITRIMKDIGDLPYLLIDVCFGYQGSTQEQKNEGIKNLVQFAYNMGCSHIIAYTANPMAANAMTKIGMKETARLYSMEVLNGRR